MLIGSGTVRGKSPGALRVFSGGTGRLLRTLLRADFAAPASRESR